MPQPRLYQDQVLREVSKIPATTLMGLQNSLAEIGEPCSINSIINSLWDSGQKENTSEKGHARKSESSGKRFCGLMRLKLSHGLKLKPKVIWCQPNTMKIKSNL